MRLVFFGSPAPAATILRDLLGRGHDVPLVVTQPDRPSGRGQRLTACPVAELARERGRALAQPTKLREPLFRDAIAAARADAAVVVAYGRIIPGDLLGLPIHGFLNVHFSLLPRHRGASPVAAAILAGDAVSGVSIMRLDPGLDTGPVFDRAEIALDGTERTGALTERMAALGAERLGLLLDRFAAGERPEPEAQDDAAATLCRPLAREEGIVDWSRTAEELDRRLRAFDPWPGTTTTLAGGRLKILDAALADVADGAPGTVVALGKDSIDVATGGGGWRLLRLQPEGRGAMGAGDFARGRRLAVGATFA